ncbi:MAG: type VI secretion system baseplate subunit TssF [Planctomycetes bacterium]|nr:type VI secretion system baseplate subunit TssF [Planctomycetota bacterium]
MKNDLLYGYYERELGYMRTLAAEFAARYPGVAGRLLLEPNQSQDPHVERLIQAFSFVAARIQMRLDDDYPELADALLYQLYPHATTPLPATTIVQFELDAQQGRQREGVPVPRHTRLTGKRVGELACQFRTAYPVRLWPLVLEQAQQVPVGHREAEFANGGQAALALRFRTASGEPLAEYALDSLRLCLDGDPSVVHALFEAFFREPLAVVLRDSTGRITRLPDGVRPVGFGADEGLYDDPRSGSLGYRLLQEYFAFAEKFLFADLTGLGALRQQKSDAASFEVLVFLRTADDTLAGKDLTRNLRLGCTPAVNLFVMPSTPIRLDGKQIEYRIVPDHRNPMHHEVHSVRGVSATRPGVTGSRDFRPFFGLQHGDARDSRQAYFHLRRQQSTRPEDTGTDVFLTLVDEEFRPVAVDRFDVLHIDAVCTNRDLPNQVILGDTNGDFLVEGFPAILRTRALRQATKALRPRLHGQARWRLVSHLSLNHLAILGETDEQAAAALTAFRELLRLYDLGDNAVSRQRIEGLVGLRGRRVTRLLPGIGAARGLHIDLTLDATKFAGSGTLLFATVLERFFGLFASINSFSQTTLHVQQREGAIKHWPPRSGERQLS